MDVDLSRNWKSAYKFINFYDLNNILLSIENSDYACLIVLT